MAAAFKRGNVFTPLLKPNKAGIECGDEVSEGQQKTRSEKMR